MDFHVSFTRVNNYQDFASTIIKTLLLASYASFSFYLLHLLIKANGRYHIISLSHATRKISGLPSSVTLTPNRIIITHKCIQISKIAQKYVFIVILFELGSKQDPQLVFGCCVFKVILSLKK